jgi:hypothetical protein
MADITPWKEPDASLAPAADASKPPYVPAAGESAFYKENQVSWAYQLDGQAAIPPYIFDSGNVSPDFAAIVGWIVEAKSAGGGLAIGPAPKVSKRRVLYCQPVFFEEDPPKPPPKNTPAPAGQSSTNPAMPAPVFPPFR